MPWTLIRKKKKKKKSKEIFWVRRFLYHSCPLVEGPEFGVESDWQGLAKVETHILPAADPSPAL